MANNADAIVVGANGKVSVAPKGSTLPATVDEALNAAFKEVGYLSEDGIQPKFDRPTDDINVWQSMFPVRKIATGAAFDLGLTMREWNKVSFPLAFGGGTITEEPQDSNNFVYRPPAPEYMDERAMVIDWYDGTKKYRLVIERGMVTGGVETAIARSGPSDLPITFSALASDGDDPWYLASNSPTMDPAAL